VVALWGARLLPFASPIANYFEDSLQGHLPNVVFLDPGFLGVNQTDEHPLGDVRDGQRLVQSLVKAFIESPHWQRGVFFITYDEWGGFFDHVRPPRVRDDRANGKDDETRMALPGRPARREGTAWRFVGPHHPRSPCRQHRLELAARWSDPEFDADVGADPGSSGLCPSEAAGTLGVQRATQPVSGPPNDLERGLENGYFERLGYRIGNWSPIR